MTKVIYHSADLDGHASGAILKHRYPEAELIGMDYGDPFPWEKIVPGEQVFMADFSLQPFSDMMRLNDLCKLEWIDHHKSAIIEWEEHNRPISDVTLQTDFAACELCWQRFFPQEEMPEAVRLLGRYDIWKHEETPGALEFQYGMRLVENTWPDNRELWDTLLDPTAINWLDIVENGRAVLQYERIQNRKYAKAFSFETTIDGYRAIAINRGMTNSLIFDSVYDPEKHDLMMLLSWRGGMWHISLYSTKPDVDVSEIAKKYGGGGHKGAAGFQAQKGAALEWLR